MTWRWDQGRLEYFQVSNIRKIAEVLSQFDGQLIDAPAADILRDPLQQATSLPYPPNNNPQYKVWRNFGRVFGQQLLAAKIGGRLIATDICRKLANGPNSLADEQYMQILVKRYASPSPGFDNYDPRVRPVYPLCAVIKFALARLKSGKALVTAQDAAEYLISNNVTGGENLEFFIRLQASRSNLDKDEVRQVREMMAVLGQIPFLKWSNYSLVIDTSALTNEFEQQIIAYATPEPQLPRRGKEEEVLNQGSLKKFALPSFQFPIAEESELSFIEGSRRRITHLRIERSPKLRDLYISKADNPSLCDMCAMDTLDKYPWSKNLIEVHHLLPLGSLLRVESRSTSLRDVVGVCPSCHKATHQFYRSWLLNKGLEDFRSTEEARLVYADAKENVIH